MHALRRCRLPRAGAVRGRPLLLRHSLSTATPAGGGEAPATPLAVTHDQHLRFRDHLLRLAWPERQRLGGGLVLLAGSSSISIVFPKAMGSVMDACLAGVQGGWTPTGAAGALFLLFGAQAVMVAARGRILAVSAERVAARLRKETFASLVLKHDAAFFDRERSGELQSRLSSDCTSLQKLVVGRNNPLAVQPLMQCGREDRL